MPRTPTPARCPSASGLNQNFNYVRNSVKVVIDAYTGKMTFYVMDPSDPIIQTYEKAFPGMFTPASKMSAEAPGPHPLPRGHLHPAGHHVREVPHHQRPKLLQRRRRVDAVAVPRFGLALAGAGHHPDHQCPGPAGLDRPGGADGAHLPGDAYVPGQTQQSFTLLDAFVPVSQQSQIQTLSGFMIAGSDPGHYGQLQMFVTPRDQPVNGPAIVAAQIDATPERVEPDHPA